MSVVVLQNPKGGSGKTTAAVLLAGALCRRIPVAILDADANQPIVRWADGSARKSIEVIGQIDEDNLLQHIDSARRKAELVLVDMAGLASKMVLMACARADLVLVPVQGSHLDAAQAGRAVLAVRQTEAVTQRAIPYRVVLTRTNPRIRTRTLAHVQRIFEDAAVPVLRTELHEREAFRAVFSFRTTLDELPRDQVANLDRAIENAEQFAVEVVSLLGKQANGGGRDD